MKITNKRKVTGNPVFRPLLVFHYSDERKRQTLINSSETTRLCNTLKVQKVARLASKELSLGFVQWKSCRDILQHWKLCTAFRTSIIISSREGCIPVDPPKSERVQRFVRHNSECMTEVKRPRKNERKHLMKWLTNCLWCTVVRWRYQLDGNYVSRLMIVSMRVRNFCLVSWLENWYRRWNLNESSVT